MQRIFIAKVLLFGSVILLMGSFHYLDIAHNMQKHNLPFDINIIGQTRTYFEVYSDGMRALMISVFFQFVAFMLIAFPKIKRKNTW